MSSLQQPDYAEMRRVVEEKIYKTLDELVSAIDYSAIASQIMEMSLLCAPEELPLMIETHSHVTRTSLQTLVAASVVSHPPEPKTSSNP